MNNALDPDKIASEIKDKFDRELPKPAYKDPTCPKCGLVLGNRMMYCCGQVYCPVGLN